MTERILRVTKEVIEHPFTTEKKNKSTININRKGSIVKEKCRQLSEIALDLFPERKINTEDLGDLIKRYIGADRETVRAYMGYRGYVKVNKSSGEGYVVGIPRKGYLEIFGFMHQIKNREWVIHTQIKLQNADLGYHNNEGCVQNVSNENFSLSGILQGKECEKTVLEVVSPNKETIGTSEIINNNNTVRERNLFHKSLDFSKRGGLEG